MGNVIIQQYTTKQPLKLMGEEAGVCWNSNVDDTEKNIKRGIDCVISGHGRIMEYVEIYMILEGYSARVIREFYTHIGGSPTRTQASTRYIDYEKGFEYVVPPSIYNNDKALSLYNDTMSRIADSMQTMESFGIPREDIAMMLPLGMSTKVVVRMNLRTLIDMSHQRLCTRAYWEFRDLMKDIKNALIKYGTCEFYQPTPNEWKEVFDLCYKPKCEVCGFCTEKKSCGHMPKKED